MSQMAESVGQWPALTGPRVLVTLAGTDRNDAHRLLTFHARNKDHLSPWLPPRPHDFLTLGYWQRWTSQSVALFDAEIEIRLTIRSLDNPQGDVIGQINFNTILRGAAQSCTVGYHIAEEFEGRGLMSEGFDLAVNYMFEQRGLHRVVAKYMPENQRSARMLERLGFEREGLARADLFIGGSWRDHVVTAKINQDSADPVPGAPL